MKSEKVSQLSVRNFKMSPYSVVDNSFFQWKEEGFKKLVVEIGCGVGYHPLQFSKTNSETGIVAIERTKAKFKSFERRLVTHDNPANIYPVNGDALNWLPANVLKETVDEYFMLYPNPYPKEAQANKRWHRNPLMHKILESLKTKGKINIATNEKWLMEETLLYMQDFWNMNLTSTEEIVGEIPNPLTHFEKKYLKKGDTCYRMVFSK